jgi:hypothetical protein
MESQTCLDRYVTRRLRIVIVSAIMLILLPLEPGKLFAQQAPLPAQGWQQNDQYNGQYSGQYAPNPQSGYGQPAYQQPDYAQQQPNLDTGYSDSGQQYPQQGYGSGYGPAQPSAQPLNTEQLEQLVAPIALYPDALVAQVLAAATYPAQVVDADHWRQAQGYVSPDQIAAGANAQNWDPSLKALTAFPQLLAEMDQNLRWTIALGNAYYNQPQDVLDVVQVMRQRAQTAGNLQSTPQEAVSYDQGFIQVAPVNPQVVYLPAYDPWSVYGQPIQPYRGFSLINSLGSFLGSSPVRFGIGMAMSAFTHTNWGWLGWGLNWLSNSILFHGSNYYSHSTTVADWGFPHGGPRAPSYPRGPMTARLPGNSYRQQNGYNRSGNEPNRFGNYNGYRPGSGQGIVRPREGYAENRGMQTPMRPYASPGTSYARPPMDAYNRIQSPIARPQSYGRPSPVYGNGYNGVREGGYGYGARSNPVYSTQSQPYRAPSSGFERGNFGERYSGSNPGRGFEGYSDKHAKSGGFHLFGGGHQPKESHSEKSFSHGHSGGGGHSGGKHHH